MARRSSFYDDYYPRYTQISAEELRMKARFSAAEAGKRGKTYAPVIPRGRGATPCTSWWGRAWCQNLDRYAVFSNRLSRGVRYLNSGAVIDLQIQGGTVSAKVQGTRRTPYDIQVTISPISREKADEILERCSSSVDTLDKLVAGEFPESLKSYFTAMGGLFPTPQEIHFRCSCPDPVTMCKHVAAVMYGIGVRLDENPFIFFALRGLDMDAFIDSALSSRVESMLKNYSVKSSRIMTEDEDLSEIFGVF